MQQGLNLVAQQKQSLTLTAQVIQSIKLLQCGQEELLAYLREQEEKNPLIEVVAGPDADARRAPDAASDENGAQFVAEANSEDLRQGKHGARVADNQRRRSAVEPRREGGKELRSLEETCASSASLQDHLRGQAMTLFKDPVERAIAIEIVEAIEPDGYLRRDLDEIAEFLEVSRGRVESALMRIQGLEPTGVAARSLAECLHLQLQERGRLTPAMATLLDNLDLLEKYDLERLAKRCGVDGNGVANMIKEIRELDPRPGRRFDSDPVLPALPDLNVDMRSDGSFQVELNSSLLPKVLVDREYYAEVSATALGADETRFVTDCLKDANWLVRNLDLRAKTILKVSTEIVKRQKEFFQHGVAHLKPLSLYEVAETLGMHKSTVCRATSNKYMMTNRGMFELKFFFASALNSSYGELSSESIRHKIRQMIDDETPETVMSDDAIMEALRKDGVDIARRTVAKYREMMHIPSSPKRKRQKRAKLVENGACLVGA